MMPDGPILPVWAAAPLAGLAMLVLMAHLAALANMPMPESRRRIRTANGALMLMVTPLMAYAFSVAAPSRPRAFVLAWTMVAGMLGLIVLLACVDVLNSLWIHRREERALRAHVRMLRRGAASPSDERGRAGGGGGGMAKGGSHG